MSKQIGTKPYQTPRNADLGTMAYIDPHEVQSEGGAYTGKVIYREPIFQRGQDNSGLFGSQALSFGISSQTRSVVISLASGVYSACQLHITGYSSAGQGAAQGFWVMGGHVANTTLFRIKEVDNYTHGNISIGTPYISSGLVKVDVTHTGGNGGLITVMFTAYEVDENIAELYIE